MRREYAPPQLDTKKIEPATFAGVYQLADVNSVQPATRPLAQRGSSRRSGPRKH